MTSGFYQRVYETVAKIPRGRVVTYGQIALHLGILQGARAVGWAMRQCPGALPWHRVVNAQGGMSKGSHPEDCSLQRDLLEQEGVTFDAFGHIDLHIFGWNGI